MADFSFFADISSHLATVSLKLQQREQLIHVIFSHAKAFQAKLKLFGPQLGNKNLSHFPVMAHMNYKEYAPNFVKCTSELQNTFNERFHDFCLQVQNIIFVPQPFSVEAENAPTELLMELIDLQGVESIKKKFDEIPVKEFYLKYVPSKKFSKLKKNAARIISVFGKYVCKEQFSRIKHKKQECIFYL